MTWRMTCSWHWTWLLPKRRRLCVARCWADAADQSLKLWPPLCNISFYLYIMHEAHHPCMIHIWAG
jgi:hypothetical protein